MPRITWRNKRTGQYRCLGEPIVMKILRVDAITQLLDNLQLPILTYGSEVWYPYTEQLEGDPIEQLFKSSTGYKQPHENAHIKFCRQILGVHNKINENTSASRTRQVSCLTQISRPSHCVLGAHCNI